MGFGRWSMDKLLCAEISLVDYIKNTPARFSCTGSSGIYVPHTAGRYQTKRFRKALCPIADDARTQQREEAEGDPHHQAGSGDYPPAEPGAEPDPGPDRRREERRSPRGLL